MGVGIDASDCSGQVTSGDICTVRCSPGFDGMAQDYVCNPFTTMFHGEAMNCTRQRCLVQSLPTSAELDLSACQDTAVGDFCLVSCAAGYEPADSSFECRSDRLFYGNPPTCSRLPCDVATLPVALGLDTSNCQNLFVGNQCEVSCSAGYQAASNSVNPATLQCHLNTSFTGTAPLCQPKECLVPSTWAQDPTFNTTCAGTTHGETCVAQCSQGYTGPSTQFLCDNGNLAGTPPTCTGIVCAFQGFELSVGLLASDCYQKTTGETCQMQCIRGYDLTGDASSTCQADGSFTSISSACHPKTCSSLQSVTPFSTIDVVDTCGQNSTFGEVCMSFCDTGFDMSGNATVLVCDEAPATSAGYIEYVPETAQTFPAEQSSGPTCAARNCTVGIPNVLGGTSDCAGKVTYETCTVEASLGYTLQAGESNTLLCQAGGAFNQTAPTILPGTCADPSFDAGVGSSCQSQQIGSHCWAYCLSGWSGVSQRYNCEANVTANALLLQPDTTGIQCTWTGRRLSRRLQAGCDSTSVSAAGLADAQYYQDCDGKANNEVCIAHCSFGWTMTEAAPSIYTCSSGSLTGASLPTCTPAPCTFDFPSGLGILHDCDGVRTQQTCTATCIATGYTYATGASAEVYTCQAAGNVQGTLPQCQRTACTDLSLAATYVHDCVGKLYQDSCGVSCAAGFRGAGAQFSCQGDGSFAGTLPACVGNPCSNDLPNSSIWTATCDGLTTGQSCDVSCNPGFSGASTNLTCDASGQLLGTVPVCAPQLCPSSIQLVSVEHTHTCQDIAFGSSCTVFCAAGYALDTGSTIQDWSCGLVGGSLQLQGTLPSCVPVPCVSGLPANTSQVVSDCEGLRTGEQCHQHCAVGYENTTEETNFVCQSNGLATGSQTSCQPIACEGMSVNLSRVQHTCQSGSVFPRSCYASCIQGYSAPVEQWFCGDESMGPALGFEVYKGVTLRGSMPNCTASPCEFNLPVGSLYSHNCSGVVTGEDCLVSCADGWEGMPEVLTCGADAALAGSFPLCTAITSTVSTSVSTVTSTMTRTFTDAQAATTTSVTSTVLNQTCPQELPDVPGAGVFNCTGWTVAQECRADCESQNGTEAVIVCKYDFQWEVLQTCPSLDAPAALPILLYVGITVGSCAACMVTIAVLTYIARASKKVSPDSRNPKIPQEMDFSTKQAFVEEQPFEPDGPKTVEARDVEQSAEPAKKTPPPPPPPPKRAAGAGKDVMDDVHMHAAGLGGTAEPQSSVVLASTPQQLDPDFWDWANQFWDWANQSDRYGQQSLPPPPPPLIPTSSEMLRSFGARGDGPPPLPPLPQKLHSKPALPMSPSSVTSGVHSPPPPMTPSPSMLKSQVSLPTEDPSPLHSLTLPSQVEMDHHISHTSAGRSTGSLSVQETLEGLLYNPEIDSQHSPSQERRARRPRSRPGRRRRAQEAERAVSPNQERRNSRAAANLHDGASMSTLEMFHLRPGMDSPPALPAMRLSSPESNRGSAAATGSRSGSATPHSSVGPLPGGRLRQAAAGRDEVRLNIGEGPYR